MLKPLLLLREARLLLLKLWLEARLLLRGKARLAAERRRASVLRLLRKPLLLLRITRLLKLLRWIALRLLGITLLEPHGRRCRRLRPV